MNSIRRGYCKKILQGIGLGLCFFFFVSWFYRLICLYLIVLIWKDIIRNKIPCRYVVTLIHCAFAAVIFFVMPRYRIHTDDRIQLIYQNQKGEVVHPPLSHYLINVIFPEEEVMNLCIWGARLGVGNFPFVGNGTLLRQFQLDVERGKIDCFYAPAQKLNHTLSFVMSGTTSQVCNMIGLPKTQSVYLIKPKDFHPEKKYPVVFFCHGGLGNWKLYQGLWKDLEDCIVLSIGTKDWTGFFQYTDIKQLLTCQLPFLKKMGYQIDESQLHIMGLSNGGTAVNIAYKCFAKRFKSISFLSTGIHQTFPVQSKIVMLGGGRDGSSASLPRAHRQLKSKGSRSALYWVQDETHFILVNQQEEVLRFLNKELFQ